MGGGLKGQPVSNGYNVSEVQDDDILAFLSQPPKFKNENKTLKFSYFDFVICSTSNVITILVIEMQSKSLKKLEWCA